tara:strand:- start:1905 stop:2510 length:606 start_codon:yes stop_codon:yes gene_type:complete
MSGIVASNILDSTGIVKAPASGGWAFISKQTASSSSTIDFTSGIDSTYKEYVFYFKNIHPSGGTHVEFTMNLSSDAGSNYNVTKTTTMFRTYHEESGGSASLLYQNEYDLAQSTGEQPIMAYGSGTDADSNISGSMILFNPSSTVFVKHFLTNISGTDGSYEHNHYIGGYGNTTSAINGVRFKFSSGNIDAGDICLYGLTT